MTIPTYNIETNKNGRSFKPIELNAPQALRDKRPNALQNISSFSQIKVF